MTTALTKPGEDPTEYGPAMQGLTQLQRNFVTAAMEHPTYSQAGLAKEAGYSTGGADPAKYFTVVGHNNMHNPAILAAMDEEADRRMRYGGAIGVAAVVKIALNESHKDHLKASLALMNRTGRHEMTEHKVIVDDKRPETKQELLTATKRVLEELGMSVDDAKAFIKKTTGEDIVDAEFSEVVDVDAVIAKQMEEL